MTQLLHAGTVSELTSAGSLVVTGPIGALCVVRDGERYYAFDDECSHMGSPLHRGILEDGCIVCPWHRARFLLKNGESLDLYATRITTYRVTLIGKDLFIDIESPLR